MSFEAWPKVALLAVLLVGCAASPPTPSPDSPEARASAQPSVVETPSPPVSAAPEVATPSPPVSAPSATSSVPAPPTGPTYVACGCGCCGGGGDDVPPKDVCLYKSKGDSLDKIIAQDKLDAKRSICRVVGCSLGTRYRYCD
jgi:hypothetical protein